jgi:hypothetical protein
MSSEYKGMSDEAAAEYEKRQAEPLFQTASSMIPMAEVKQHFENLLCGYHKRYGCNLLVRDVCFYACIWHQAIQATGTDFFMYYRLINDNELDRMSAAQHTALEERHRYETKWCNNFPRGALP